MPEGFELVNMHETEDDSSPATMVVRSDDDTQLGCLACWIEDDLVRLPSERLGPRMALADDPGHENTERHVKAAIRATGVVPQVQMFMCPQCGT